jgi:hypothetical protein
MDKKEIFFILSNALEEEIKTKQNSLETVKEAVFEAPGRMETRYDTVKTEMGWLADGLNKRLFEVSLCLKKIKMLPCSKIIFVTEGSLLT